MKRTITFILLIAVILALYFYTSQNTPAQITKTDTSQQESVIKLRFGHNSPVTSALHQAALRFAEEVKQKSKGKVVIEVFPSQKLGNDHQMVEMARDGDLDIILTPTAKMSVAVPSMQYADLPFFFPKREDVYTMLDGEPGKMLLNNLHSIGLVGVTFWENGFKQFTANSPILSPDDFKGKKIRVMKSKIIMEQFKSFGAEPVPIDFYSTKKALADGVVDGEENPLIAIVGMKFYEVQSDITLSDHAYLGYVFSISEKVFKKLPQNVRALLIDVAKEITPWERKETKKREDKLLAFLKKYGMKIHTLSDIQRQNFSKLCAHIPKQFEDVIGPNIISKTEELLYNKYSKKDNIVIGIDADLSMDGQAAGLSIKRGAELAAYEINKAGGLLGKKVVIIAKDHRVLASQGVKNINEFAQRGDVVAIIGGKQSAIINGEMKTIQKNHIPYLVPWAAASKLTQNDYKDNYVFRVSANDKFISKLLASHALKYSDKVAVLVENSIWGRSCLQDIQKYLHSKGIPPVSSIIVNRGQKSFDEDINQVISAGAKVLILVTNSVEGSKTIKTLSNKNAKLKIVSHWGIINGDFFEDNAKYLKKIPLEFIQTFLFTETKNPLVKTLLNNYKTMYHQDPIKKMIAPSGIAQSYDLVHLLALAVKKAGTTNSLKVKKALENLPPYRGLIKTYNPAFTKNRHDALDANDFFLAKYNTKGIIVPEYKGY